MRDLKRVLEKLGAVTLKFGPNDVFYEDISVYQARSRDDNLAQLFHRDGILSVTLQPGIDSDEVEIFLDQLLHISARDSTDQDLVTLLWEANLQHIGIACAPIAQQGRSNDDDSVAPSPMAWESRCAPWPKPILADEAPPPTGEIGRSDDWRTHEEAGDFAGVFTRLAHSATAETERFLKEFDDEQQEPITRAALEVIEMSLAANATPEDVIELATVLPRVFHEAIRMARWGDAQRTLALARSVDSPQLSAGILIADLTAPSSGLTAQCVTTLDAQPADEIGQFVGFAEDLGLEAVEWLMTVLAQSQQKAVRRPLTRAIANICRSSPERLAPWLSNKDWFVVRNVVHICGWIGGENVAKILRDAATHSEARVRKEVAAALTEVDRNAARPILVDLIEGAEPRLLDEVLHQLSREHDLDVARKLLHLVLEPEFEARPRDQKRRFYGTLAACGGDGIVPALEAELFQGSWLRLSPSHRHRALVSCLLRINTAKARAVLLRGSQSWRLAVRKVCRAAHCEIERHG